MVITVGFPSTPLLARLTTVSRLDMGKVLETMHVLLHKERKKKIWVGMEDGYVLCFVPYLHGTRCSGEERVGAMVVYRTF